MRHRRNQPPGYTDAVLDDVDAKAAEFVALLQAHWMEDQKSEWFTDKARIILNTRVSGAARAAQGGAGA